VFGSYANYSKLAEDLTHLLAARIAVSALARALPPRSRAIAS
jgi:hypothetical protein